MELELSNIINVSVSQEGAGAGEYNTSNVALFSQEPAGNGFGALGYKIYLSPDEVATDFGTESETYKQALAIFSQQPNILANNGYLVVIPLVNAVQNLALDGVPASGTFTLTYLGNPTAAINWDDTATQIQVKVRAVAGLEGAVVTGSLSSQSLNIGFKGVYGPVALLTVGGVGLETGASASITITPTTSTAGEKLGAAITRTKDLVQYFGIMASLIIPEADMLLAAAVVQALNKMAFFVSKTAADVDPGGMLDLLRSGGFTKSRGLFYGGATEDSALVMMAAYVGRGLSTNFAGSNTTQTMHLKDLNGVQPDPSMTQTLLESCKDAGADIYASFQGIPKVFCSGENDFFDDVYNLEWFVGALQIAGFNALAQVSTKIPQTEAGMGMLKNAYRGICEQAANNQFLAPGAWTSPTTFGNQADLLANVSQRGYYIYSSPVASQSAAARASRAAPLVQIAAKYAGAIHSSTVIVNVNK